MQPSGRRSDLSASGYLHLLPSGRMRSKVPGDNRQMVQARRNFVRERGAPSPSATRSTASCWRHCKKNVPLQILDAGCGEGYYPDRLAQFLGKEQPDFSITGVDISKFAVDAAAKGYAALCRSGQAPADRVQYGVASVFELPVKDHSCHVVTNLFAPVCIEEYHRVLRRGGILIFAVTSTRHLWELWESIYDQPYENEKFDHEFEEFLKWWTNRRSTPPSTLCVSRTSTTCSP